MNPWLTQNLAEQRRAEMVEAATRWRLTHTAQRRSFRSIAGRWLISAGQIVAGPQGPATHHPDLTRTVIRLGS